MVPPPIDREKKTDPPPSELPKAPSPDALSFSAGHARRLSAIEERLGKLDELHAILTGAASDPDGKSRPAVLDAILEMNKRLAIIQGNSEIIVAKHKEYVDEVARVHHENVLLRRDFHKQSDELEEITLRVDAIETRVDSLESARDA